MRRRPIFILPLLFLQAGTVAPSNCDGSGSTAAGGPSANAFAGAMVGNACNQPNAGAAWDAGSYRNDNAEIIHGLGTPEIIRGPLENRRPEYR